MLSSQICSQTNHFPFVLLNAPKWETLIYLQCTFYDYKCFLASNIVMKYKYEMVIYLKCKYYDYKCFVLITYSQTNQFVFVIIILK